MSSYCWYFSRDELENSTPSREDGISYAVESRYRRDGARFIINASNTLGLRYDTMATGVVFFHRFFMIQSFRHFDRWVVASACLLLAGKVEETPKKCKDILKVTRSLLNDQQMAQFGTSPKDQLLTHERILLQTIKFDLRVEHPYSYLLKFAKGLKCDKSKVEKIVQMAWTFVNDSLVTKLCLQWEPQAIAVAFIYLAGKLSKYDLQAATHSKSRYWWRQFVDTLDVHDLESICHQVLDIYGEAEQKAEEKTNGAEGRSQLSDHTPQQQQASTGPPTMPRPLTQTVMTTTHYQHLPVVSNHYQPHPQTVLHPSHPPRPPPPAAPPTQTIATTAVTSHLQQPLSALPKTQTSYLPPTALNTYGLATTALHAITPLTSQPQLTGQLAQQLTRTTPGYAQAPLAYSTLNVSVASAPQQGVLGAYNPSGVQSTTTPIAGLKSLLPGLPSTTMGGVASYQMPTAALTGLTTFQPSQQQSSLMGGSVHHHTSFQSQVGGLAAPPAKRQALNPTAQPAAPTTFRAGILPPSLIPPQAGSGARMASLLPGLPSSIQPLLPPSTGTPVDLTSRLPQNFSSLTQMPSYLASQSLTPAQLRVPTPLTQPVKPLTPSVTLGQPRPPQPQQSAPQAYGSLPQGTGGTGLWGGR